MQRVRTTKAGMGRYSRWEYDRLLEAFRAHGANFSRVSAECAWTHKSVKRAYERGWPKYPWARPLKEVLEEDQQAARAAVAERLRKEREMADADAERARTGAVEVAKLEEQILQAARRNVAAAFGLSAKLVPAMDAAVEYVRSVFLNPDGTKRTSAQLVADGVDYRQAMVMLQRHAAIIERAYSVGEKIINLGRVGRKEPTAIVGVVPVEMSAEAAAEELAEQEEAIRLIKAEAESALKFPKLGKPPAMH